MNKLESMNPLATVRLSTPPKRIKTKFIQSNGLSNPEGFSDWSSTVLDRRKIPFGATMLERKIPRGIFENALSFQNFRVFSETFGGPSFRSWSFEK